MTDFDVIVIGAGVVGLACAARLARSGKTVLVLERHASLGQETSSRNSGVIHAGIYYPPASLKATLCVRGRQLLVERCQRHSVAHRQLGKLIVATQPSEVPLLEQLRAQAALNGVPLQLLDAAAVRSLEPTLQVVAALWSPETGIVDQHELMLDYRREATEHQAVFCMNTAVVGLDSCRRGWSVVAALQDTTTTRVRSEWVVNAAGLAADHVAQLAGLDVDRLGWRLHRCKGDYFSLGGEFRGAVSHLVYPVPARAGLGVHLTLDLSGGLLAGPDAEYVSSLSYDVDPGKAEAFALAIARYLPGVSASHLSPARSGIRPKLQGPGAPFRDFIVEEASNHDLPGLVNLVGIESPGLTASEAIAERVQQLIAAG